MIFNKYEQEEFDSWSKEDIYQAYLTEYQARTKLSNMIKTIDVERAALRYDKKIFEEKYFRELVKKTIPHIADEDLDTFFKSKHEIIWIGEGYLGVMYIKGKIFIAYMYSNNSMSTMKSVYNLLKGKEVYYIYSDKDYFKNNSESNNEMRRLVI